MSFHSSQWWEKVCLVKDSGNAVVVAAPSRAAVVPAVVEVVAVAVAVALEGVVRARRQALLLYVVVAACH
jgi:hypothetical protein